MNMRLFEPPNVGRLAGRARLDQRRHAPGAPRVRQGPRRLRPRAASSSSRVKGLLGSATASPAATVDLILAQIGLNAAPVGTIPPSRPVPITAAQRDA